MTPPHTPLTPDPPPHTHTNTKHRVPTTLLAIVDASVGVKNGVDFDSRACGCQKNRVGSFYAPAAALLDKSFIRTQVSVVSPIE